MVWCSSKTLKYKDVSKFCVTFDRILMAAFKPSPIILFSIQGSDFVLQVICYSLYDLFRLVLVRIHAEANAVFLLMNSELLLDLVFVYTGELKKATLFC